jgi:ubiquinone/menaquinone biosynthesis C-methylase UbiE
MRKWEHHDGVDFLRAVGARPGDIVVDFGCRVGHYTIPAALLVGGSGRVYAVDKDRESLGRLATKVQALGLENVQIIETSGQPGIDIESDSVDVVLLYDVLHYFTDVQRRDLLREAFRVLVPVGLLSVYPKHTEGDWPSKEFRELHIADVVREIEACGFQFKGWYEGLLSHDDDVIVGSVLNCRKPHEK